MVDTRPKCAACKAKLTDRYAYEAWWPERQRRTLFCKECLGELFFDLITKDPDPPPYSKIWGVAGPPEETSPSQENALRILEGD